MLIISKWSPALGTYKGMSFDEQKDIMERCSILFNPTDFCIVVFSGDMADLEEGGLSNRI